MTELINEVTMPLMIILLGAIGTLMRLMWSGLSKKIDRMEEKLDKAMGQIGRLNVSTATVADRVEHIEKKMVEYDNKFKDHENELARIKERHVRNHPGDSFDRV